MRRMYADVRQTQSMFTSLSTLAIVIACLGLFALSAYMAERRRKEVGIRKVLGATVAQVAGLADKGVRWAGADLDRDRDAGGVLGDACLVAGFYLPDRSWLVGVCCGGGDGDRDCAADNGGAGAEGGDGQIRLSASEAEWRGEVRGGCDWPNKKSPRWTEALFL